MNLKRKITKFLIPLLTAAGIASAEPKVIVQNPPDVNIQQIIQKNENYDKESIEKVYKRVQKVCNILLEESENKNFFKIEMTKLYNQFENILKNMTKTSVLVKTGDGYIIINNNEIIISAKTHGKTVDNILPKLIENSDKAEKLGKYLLDNYFIFFQD